MKGRRTYIKLIGVLFVILLFSCNETRIGENDFGTLEGKVVSIGDNMPIPNVKITTNPASSTVFTDSLGEFIIEYIPVREYVVEAENDDYISDSEIANVVANTTVVVVFELEISTANNRPPSAPELIAPTENEVLQSIEAVFEWESIDPEGDEITYSLELRNDQNEDVLTFEDITETTFTHTPLELGAQYFWQVSATDEFNDPVLSPLGTFSVIHAPVDNRFLFTRNIEGNNVIFSADEEGNEFQLTSQNLNSYRPRRNVAANRIAYLQSDGAQVDIYTMKRDGTDKQKVTGLVRPTGFNLNEINISWPPTSDKIYFPQLDKLYRINSDGQGIQLVYQTPDGSLISEVDVSENADIIALKTNDLSGYNISIYTIDFAGNVLDTILTDVPGGASGLNLSVTNNMVLYAYDVSGFESANYRRLDSRLFIYNYVDDTTNDVSGTKPDGTNDLEPIFSPNEAFVIYTNTSNDGISQKDVYDISLEDDGNGTFVRTLLFSNAFMPDWE